MPTSKIRPRWVDEFQPWLLDETPRYRCGVAMFSQIRPIPENMLKPQRMQNLAVSTLSLFDSIKASLQDIASDYLNQKLAKMEERLSKIENAKPFYAQIQTLAPEQWEILKPISVTIRESGGEFLADFLDVNLASSGETEYEAIENLKEVIVSTAEFFVEHDDEQLGKLMIRQKAALKAYVQLAV